MTKTTETLRATSEDKIAPEELELRAKPRPITRLNRKIIIGLSAASVMIILGATFFALQAPPLMPTGNKELYNTLNKDRPEELTSLPKSYDQVKPPQLGAPLPGELGKAVLDAERRAGLKPLPATPGSLPFQTDPLTDQERAERIRLAQRAQQGRESKVLFQLSRNVVPTVPTITASGATQANAASQSADDKPLTLQRDQDPGLQARKIDFLNKGPEANVINPHAMETPTSPYQVLAGTIIAASLITGLNSDIPGQVIAQVTQPVYDTVTGSHLLIPQGSRLLGKYDSVVAFGQERALVVWQRLILPDGSSVVIENLPATDRAGSAGLEDQVDFHTWKLVKGIALSTLLNVGTELAFSGDSDLIRALQSGPQTSINRAGQRITERYLDIQPTIKIRPGYPLRVIVHKDLILRPFKEKGL